MTSFDLVFRSATIVDGTRRPRFVSDVAVAGDRVVAVDRVGDAIAKRTIDAKGLVLAPGFVDVHNHSEGWLLKLVHLTSKTQQGYTTEVLFSDGISYAPVTRENAVEWIHYLRSLNGLELADYRGWRSIADYMGLLDGRVCQNVLAQVPYANLRVIAKDWSAGGLDDTQMRHVQHQIREAFEAGAAALSTGLDYIAEWHASTDELAEACSAMRPHGGLYVTHVRYKKGILPAVREAVEIARRAGVPLHISHLKGEAASRRAEDGDRPDAVFEYLDRVSNEVDYSFDVYPYLPGSTMLHSLLPNEVWNAGPLAALARLGDAAMRPKIAAGLAATRAAFEQIRLAWTPTEACKRHRGRAVVDILADRQRPIEDAFAEFLIDENMAALGVMHLGDDRLIEPCVAHPKCMIGSDGIYQPNGVIHPRQYGTAPRVLGPFVRTREVLSLEEAVHKLSGFPATRFGLVDRGVIREGAFADLVLFDPETVEDRATYENPHQPPVGISHVLVNGQFVVDGGQAVTSFADRMPGRALRFKC